MTARLPHPINDHERSCPSCLAVIARQRDVERARRRVVRLDLERRRRRLPGSLGTDLAGDETSPPEARDAVR